jgi:uncharacterized protein (DUF1330 family)
MPAYLVTHLKVSDPHKYQAYTALTPAPLFAAGGRMLARGPAEVIEGRWDEGRIVILEFPTLEAARSFYDSDGYRQAIQARHGATEFFDTVIVPGVD